MGMWDKHLNEKEERYEKKKKIKGKKLIIKFDTHSLPIFTKHPHL